MMNKNPTVAEIAAFYKTQATRIEQAAALNETPIVDGRISNIREGDELLSSANHVGGLACLLDVVARALDPRTPA